MFSFWRWPRRYFVRVQGSNFSFLLDEKQKSLVGFYTNRWVDAFNPDQAKARAFASVRSKLIKKGYGSIVGELKLTVDELREIGFWTERWSKTQGFVFYRQDGDS